MRSVFRCVVMAVGVAAGGWSVTALASSGGNSFKEGVNYIAIKPALVVNYGGSGRVKYIKAELSLRTEDLHGAEEVSHHMPIIRDTLIMLISSVSDEQMASGEGKEKMRLEALAKINEVLERVNKPAQSDVDKTAHNEHAAPDKTHKDQAQGDKTKGDKTKVDKDVHSKDAEHAGPVSDLLFDNLVVQK